MIIDWLSDIQQARLLLFKSRMDAGNSPGQLLIYTGPKPSPGNPITTHIILGTVTFVKPIGTIEGSVFTFTSPGDVLAVNTGAAAWGRFQDGEGFWVGDASVGLIGSGALIQVDRLDWTAGGILHLVLSYLAEPT